MCMVDEADAQATCVDPTAPELEPPGGQPTMPYLPPANVDAQTARARAELQAGLYDGNEQPSPRIYKCTEANPYGLPPAPIPDVEWSGPYRGPKVVMPGTPGDGPVVTLGEEARDPWWRKTFPSPLGRWQTAPTDVPMGPMQPTAWGAPID